MDVLIKNHPSADKGIDMTTPPPPPPPFVKWGSTPSGCRCPSWVFRPASRPCKHVRRLRDAIATLAEYRAAQASRSSGRAYRDAAQRF